MTEEESKKYAASLFERRTEGIILKRAEIVNGDWKPQVNYCHDNVNIWCSSKSEYKPVRGWLYFDLCDELDYVQFLPHSAILTPEGELYDITPSNATQDYPFIKANLSDAEFKSVQKYLINQNLRHYK